MAEEKTTKDRIVSALKVCDLMSSLPDEDAIVHDLSNFVNAFGYPKKELLAEIEKDEKSRKNFLILASGCMYTLGYERFCEITRSREHWDDRNQASMEYCYRHLDALKAVFCEISGKEIEMSEKPKYQYALDECFVGSKEVRRSGIRKNVAFFMCSHPTLMQSMVGIFVSALHAYEPDIFAEDGFPLV